MNMEERTLGEVLSEESIARIAPDAIKARDLSQEKAWGKTIRQLREEHFFSGKVGNGLLRLLEAAKTGEWYYPLYSEEECAEDGRRKNVNLLWLPSADPAADGKPYLFLVPGGGFENVWNLTEGWPIGDAFNRLGYHAFVLTYQVGENEGLLEKNMEDFARALELIRDREAFFHVRADRYITCGFSAGGYLVCLWNTGKGYPAFGLPKPQAVFPIYPFVSPALDLAGDQPETDTEEDLKEDFRLYGCTAWDAIKTDYEVPEHAEGFPPCALFLAGDDGLVNPDHSRRLAAALEKAGIPCRLEIGPEGGHGFADGTGMCMAGWTERAVRWYERL